MWVPEQGVEPRFIAGGKSGSRSTIYRGSTRWIMRPDPDFPPAINRGSTILPHQIRCPAKIWGLAGSVLWSGTGIDEGVPDRPGEQAANRLGEGADAVV